MTSLGDERTRASSPSVLKTAALLEQISKSPRPMGISDLARATSLPKSTVYSLLGSLNAVGFVHRSPVDSTYALGPLILELAWRHMEGGGLIQRFIDEGHAFAIETGETVQLALLDGNEVVYLAKVDGGRPVALTSRPGARLPASTTALGKALLSVLPMESVEALYSAVTDLPRLTENSIKSKDRLFSQVDEVRRRGVSWDREETAMGVFCIAIPLGFLHGVPHAISTSFPPADALPATRVKQIESALRDVRRRVVGDSSP